MSGSSLRIKVFIDSDVIISSILSPSGASHIIVNSSDLRSCISNFSLEELNRVTGKLGIDKNKLGRLLKSRLKIIKIKLEKEKILDKFSIYTNDVEDAHIVAGAKIAKSRFLVTFNTKDYKTEKIGKDFDIRVITPGGLLQYLRSLE